MSEKKVHPFADSDFARMAAKKGAAKRKAEKEAEEALRGKMRELAEGLGELETIEDAKRWLKIITRGVTAGDLSPQAAQAGIRGCSEWLKANENQLTEKVVSELAGEMKRLKAEIGGKPRLKVR